MFQTTEGKWSSLIFSHKLLFSSIFLFWVVSCNASVYCNCRQKTPVLCVLSVASSYSFYPIKGVYIFLVLSFQPCESWACGMAPFPSSSATDDQALHQFKEFRTNNFRWSMLAILHTCHLKFCVAFLLCSNSLVHQSMKVRISPGCHLQSIAWRWPHKKLMARNIWEVK